MFHATGSSSGFVMYMYVYKLTLWCLLLPPMTVYSNTARRLSSSRRSRGESSDTDAVDGTTTTSATTTASMSDTGGGGDMDDDDDDRVPVNAHLQKDIEHLSRLESESGAAKVSAVCKVKVIATIV